MSTPAQFVPRYGPSSDFRARYGPGTPGWDEEWNHFLHAREQLLGEIDKRLTLSDTLKDSISDPAHRQSIADAIANTMPEQHQAIPSHQQNELIGAAHFYGIPNPEKMPPEALQSMLQAYRTQMKDGAPEHQHGLSEAAYNLTGMLAGGVGTLVTGLQRMPFIGDVLAKTDMMKHADQWLSFLHEGWTAPLSESDLKTFNIGQGAAGMIAYTLPVSTAFKLAGAAGKLPYIAEVAGSMGSSRLGVISRTAIKGAVASWMLEGGGDAPLEHRAIAIALGAGMGAGAAAGGTVGAAVGGAGVGAMAGSAVSNGDPRYMVGGALAGGLGGALLGAGLVFGRAQESFPGAGKRYYRGEDFSGGGSSGGPGSGGGSPTGRDISAFQLTEGIPEGQFETLPQGGDQRPQYSQRALPAGQSPFQLQSGGSADLGGSYSPAVQGAGFTQAPLSPAASGPIGATPPSLGALDLGPSASVAVHEHFPPQVVVNADGSRSIVPDPRNIPGMLHDASESLRTAQEGWGEAPPRDEDVAHLSDAEYNRIYAPHEAAIEGSDITKQATIMESPALIDFAQQPKLDDYDVAKAAMASNPGQINVLRNVGDVAKTVAQLARAQAEGRLMPHEMRVVQRDIMPDAAVHLSDNTLFRYVKGKTIEEARAKAIDMIMADEPATTVQYVDDRGNPTGSWEVSHTSPEHIVARQKQLERVTDWVNNSPTGHWIDGEFHPNLPFAPRAEYDILISDGLPITNKRVTQYKEHGFFEGQKVTSVEGQEFYIDKIKEGLVEVRSPFSKQSYQLYPNEILPQRATQGGIETPVPEAPQLYKDFKRYAMQYMAENSQAAGLPQIPDWTATETSSQLPRLLEDYLNEQGYSHPVTKSVLKNYFDIKRTQDFQSLVPPEEAHALEQVQAENAAQVTDRVSTVHDAAKAKNLTAVPLGNGGYEIHDDLSDLAVPVETERAAETFVHEFNREAPDVAPESSVPVELMQTEHNPGNDLEPNWHAEEFAQGADSQADQLHEAINDWADSTDPNMSDDEVNAEYSRIYEQQAGGGGNEPPAGPNGPGGAAPEDPGFPIVPREARTLAEQFAHARSNRPRDLATALDKLRHALVRYGMNMRDTFIMLENDFRNLGIDTKLFHGWYEVTTGSQIAANEGFPWDERFKSITHTFDRQNLRKGTVARIAEIQDPVAKINAMADAGFTEPEVGAMNEIRRFNDDLFRHVFGDEAFDTRTNEYLDTYINNVRRKEALGEQNPFDDIEGVLPERLKFFADMPRYGINSTRELDARNLGHFMIREVFFQKHAAAAWNEMGRMWDIDNPNTTEGGPEYQQARLLVKGWLNTVKHGIDPSHDGIVHGMTRMMQAAGLPVSERDVTLLTGGVITQMHRAALGLRMDVMVRDGFTPWLAWVETGGKWIPSAYYKWMKGGAEGRADMLQRALDNGWTSRGIIPSNADIFTRGEVDSQYGTSVMTDKLLARRESVARIGDAYWNMLPKGSRDGIQGTIADPLLWYAKENMFSRMITGEAGYQMASDGIAQYAAGAIDAQGLHKAAHLGSLEEPVRQKFWDLIEQGDYEKAAILRANELANTQGLYGATQQPYGVREAGTKGRFGMMWGSFSQNFLNYARRILTNGSPTEIMGRVGRYGIFASVMYGAGKTIGFNFAKYMWHTGAVFAGGPLLQAGAEALIALGGLSNISNDSDPSYIQGDAMRDFKHKLLMSPGAVFPYRGGVRSLTGLDEAMGSAHPFEATSRFLLTGERGGITPDVGQFLQNYRGNELYPGGQPPQQLTPEQQVLRLHTTKGTPTGGQ